MAKKKALERDLVFIDLETSGLDPDKHEILEIAACRQANDFSKPECWVERKTFPIHIDTAEEKALEINGYRDDIWREKAVPLKSALEDFVMLCDGEVTLIAHNPCFDWGFIRPALNKYNLRPTMDYHLIDSASMMWPFVMSGMLESVKLEKCCDFWNVSNHGAHGARRDVERTMEVYKALVYRQGQFK